MLFCLCDTYKDNDFLTNVSIQNYNMYCQSSLSHAGGVALYVKSGLDCTSRLDLSVTEQEYETIWTEIKNPEVFYAVAHIGIPIVTFLNLLNI